MAQLDRELSASELSDWLAFQYFEPFGCAVEDHRAGRIASLIYNTNKSEAATALGPMDFFDRGDPPEENPVELTEEEVALHGEQFLMKWPGYAEALAAKLAEESDDLT